MSFWYSNIDTDRPTSIATGQSTLGEIYDAAREQSRLVENTTARADAYTRAYEERIRAVQAATGETTANPMYMDPVGEDAPKIDPARGVISDTERQAARLGQSVDRFNTWLSDVAKRHPDKVDIIRPDTAVETDAKALAKYADERLAKSLAARDGVGKWAALFAGGGVGAMYDPIQVMTLALGGGPGAARSVGGRILTTALKEAAINGAVEAAMQPIVQDWRRQAGLEAGFSEAAQNVLFAAGLGGALGGVFQAGAEGVSRVFRGADLDRAAEAVAAAPSTRPEIREALSGNALKAADSLAPIRDALPADARGAIDGMAEIRRIDEIRPAAASTVTHDQAVNSALRSVQDNSPFHYEPDPDQVERLVSRLVPDRPGPAKIPDDSLQQFLMRAGGVQDFRGELEALGLSNVSERFTGRLVRDTGMPLDEARRSAAEAGFLNHLYGTPDEAMEKSTVRDLLDELDTASRPSAAPTIDDGGRAYAGNLVHELISRAGPAVDDELIFKAAELANSDGLPPADALDRVLLQADEADRAAEAVSRAPSPPDRIEPAQMRGGLDDPGKPIEDTFFSDADLEGLPDDFEIPFFGDGTGATPDDIVAELDRLDHLFSVVEACKA